MSNLRVGTRKGVPTYGTAFGLPHILNNLPGNRLIISLFCLCILALPTAGWFIVRYALGSIKKEYQKLAEYLTVEQKLESALGLDRPIAISFAIDRDRQIFPDDECLLYYHWVESRKQNTAMEFVKQLLKLDEGLHVPLVRALRILYVLDAAVFVAVAVIVIASM